MHEFLRLATSFPLGRLVGGYKMTTPSPETPNVNPETVVRLVQAARAAAMDLAAWCEREDVSPSLAAEMMHAHVQLTLAVKPFNPRRS
jgi:hypothetical protein